MINRKSTIRFSLCLCVSVVLLGSFAAAQFNGTVTVQPVANSLTGSDVAPRTGYPVGFPYTFKQGDIADTSALKLTGMGVSAGQFLVTSRWPDDDSVKSIWADAIANYTAPGNTMTLALTGGSGNFGGSNLAVDNAKIKADKSGCEATGHDSGFICVDTGAALFEIRKADYAAFTKVVVNGKVIVDDAVRASDGLVVVGPPSANATNAVPPAPSSAPTVTHVACNLNTDSGCPTGNRTYVVKVSYVNASGESMPSPASASAVWTGATLAVPGEKLQVACPSGVGVTPAPLGCFVYVGSTSANASLYLQQPVGKPLALGATWTEPSNEVVSGTRYCHVPMRDSTTDISTMTRVPQARCQGTGGVLNYTQNPQFYAVAGNSGCYLEVPDGSGGYVASCTTAYKSSLDDGSTATVEENGPVKAIIKGIGSYASSQKTCSAASDSSGNETAGCYGRYTDRLYFYKGQTWVKRDTIDRNADYVPASTGTETYQASDTRGRRAWELRTALAGADVDAGAKTYSFKANTSNTDCSGQICTGSLAGTALLYQAYSPYFERVELNGGAYLSYYPPIIALGNDGKIDPVSGPNRLKYGQEGYVIQHNGTVITSRNADETLSDPAHEVANMGWGDCRDSNGRGIQMGIWYMAAAYPGELKCKQASGNNYDVVVGLMPDQTDPLATATINPNAAMAYYVNWPLYEEKETFWNFHDAALSAPDAEFAKYQQFLLGRPALGDVNRSEYFTELYPLISGPVFKAAMNAMGGNMAAWDLPRPQDYMDVQLWIRNWRIGQPGEGNQNELPFSKFMNWLAWGQDFSTSYLYAKMDYRFWANQGLPRADGFATSLSDAAKTGWRHTCGATTCPALDDNGLPVAPPGISAGAGKYPLGNFKYGFRNFADDDQHQHFNRIVDFAPLSGDPGLIEAVNQGYADIAVNTKIRHITSCTDTSGPCFAQTRNVGNQLAMAASAYRYFESQGNTTDAALAKTRAEAILDVQVPQTALGYGFSGTRWGQSPVQGSLWIGVRDDGGDMFNSGDSHCPNDTTTNCGTLVGADSTAGTRVTDTFMDSIVWQGLFDLVEAFGPTWTKYQKSLDMLYGGGVNFISEGGWVERNNVNGCLTKIGSSIPACSVNTADPGCYPGNPCSGGTYWRWYEFYNADKVYYLGHTLPNTLTFQFALPILVSGNPDAAYQDASDQAVNVRNAFGEYMQLRQAGSQGVENGSEEWATFVGMFIDEDGNSPAASGKAPLTKFTWKNLPGNPQTPGGHWIDVPFTGPSGCAGQTSCTLTGASPGNLTWAAPASVVAYRMKMNADAKAIVDFVRLDNVTNPHADGSGCADRYTASAESGGGAGIPPDLVSGSSSPYSGGHWWYGCWLDNPSSSAITVNGKTWNPKWPWFSSGEVTNLPTTPLPTSFNPTTVERNGTAGAYVAAGQNTFALRAYVTSSVPTAYLTGNCAQDNPAIGSIILGDSCLLNWSATNTTSAAITDDDPTNTDIGAVVLPGSTEVSPTVGTVYTLTATGPNGTATSTFTIAVTAPPPVPTAHISVNPPTITAGQSATLMWDTTDAGGCGLLNCITISPVPGNVSTSGSWPVSPDATTTYIITARGAGGVATAQTTLIVTPVIPPGPTGTSLNGATAKGAKVQ